MTCTVVTLTRSLRGEWFTRKLADAFAELAPSLPLYDQDLEVYDQDLEAGPQRPAAFSRWAATLGQR